MGPSGIFTVSEGGGGAGEDSLELSDCSVEVAGPGAAAGANFCILLISWEYAQSSLLLKAIPVILGARLGAVEARSEY